MADFLGYCNKAEFLAAVRREESARNAGVLTRYDSITDQTQWTVAGAIVGVSGGVVGASTWYKLA